MLRVVAVWRITGVLACFGCPLVSDVTHFPCYQSQRVGHFPSAGADVCLCTELSPVSLLPLRNDATQPPRLMWECWLLTIQSVYLGIRKLILPVCGGHTCFCLGMAVLYLLLQLQPYQDLIVLWEWSIFKHWLFCFLGCSCHLLASPKVLFLSTFSSFTPAGVSTHLFVKADDQFSLSKAKEHLFSRDSMHVSWMISNKVLSNVIKTLEVFFFPMFSSGERKDEISQILRMVIQ